MDGWFSWSSVLYVKYSDRFKGMKRITLGITLKVKKKPNMWLKQTIRNIGVP